MTQLPITNRLLVCVSALVAAGVFPVCAWTSHTASHVHLAASPVQYRPLLNRTRILSPRCASTRLCAHNHNSRGGEGDYSSEDHDHSEDEYDHEESEDDYEEDHEHELSSDHVELFRFRLLQNINNSPLLDITPLESYHVGGKPLLDARILSLDHDTHVDDDESEYDFFDDEYCDPFSPHSSCHNEEECEIPTHLKGVMDDAENPVDVMAFLGIKRAVPLQVARHWE
jgi:hypothetical protein